MFGLGMIETAVIGAGLAAGLLVLVVVLLRGMRRRPAIDPDAGLDEDLSAYPPEPPEKVPRLRFEGRPVRIRLVVLAGAGRNVELAPSMADQLLEEILFGLGALARQDRPRIRVWPPQLSQSGFAPKFFRHVRRPEPTGMPSRWVLAAGPARAGSQLVLLGIGLETAEPTTRGNVALDATRWPELLRVQQPT